MGTENGIGQKREIEDEKKFSDFNLWRLECVK